MKRLARNRKAALFRRHNRRKTKRPKAQAQPRKRAAHEREKGNSRNVSYCNFRNKTVIFHQYHGVYSRRALENKRANVPAKPVIETQTRAQIEVLPFAAHEIQIAIWVRIFEIEIGRRPAVLQGQNAKNRLDDARRAEQMAGVRFRRGHRDFSSQSRCDAARFNRVVLARRGAMRVDVANFWRARFSQRVFDGARDGIAVGRHRSEVRGIAVQRGAAQKRVDFRAAISRVRFVFQNQKSFAPRGQKSVAPRVERPNLARFGKRAHVFIGRQNRAVLRLFSRARNDELRVTIGHELRTERERVSARRTRAIGRKNAARRAQFSRQDAGQRIGRTTQIAAQIRPKNPGFARAGRNRNSSRDFRRENGRANRCAAIKPRERRAKRPLAKSKRLQIR